MCLLDCCRGIVNIKVTPVGVAGLVIQDKVTAHEVMIECVNTSVYILLLHYTQT